MMMNKSTTAVWDVVFSMSAKQVNDNLYDQLTDRVNNPKFLRSTGNVKEEHTSGSISGPYPETKVSNSSSCSKGGEGGK